MSLENDVYNLADRVERLERENHDLRYWIGKLSTRIDVLEDQQRRPSDMKCEEPK